MINHKITTSIRGFAASYFPLFRPIIPAMPNTKIVSNSLNYNNYTFDLEGNLHIWDSSVYIFLYKNLRFRN